MKARRQPTTFTTLFIKRIDVKFWAGFYDKGSLKKKEKERKAEVTDIELFFSVDAENNNKKETQEIADKDEKDNYIL